MISKFKPAALFVAPASRAEDLCGRGKPKRAKTLGWAFAIICASVLPGTARADLELLLNPSFEIGSGSLPINCGAGCSYSLSSTGATPDTTTIPDWTISNFTGGAGVYVPGGTALEPVPDGVAVAFTSGGSIYQTAAATVVAGDMYTLTAWIANGTGGYNQFVQSAYVYGTTGTLFSASATGVTEGYWTQVSGTWTAPTADAGDPMTVFLFNQGGSGQAQFDDVSLVDNSVVTPEPASLALLGTALGGLGFLRRRKHAA